MTETTNPSPNISKIARYDILHEIGRGGMAAVYLAHDPNFGRDVAIKVLPRELLHDPAFRARFHREARTIAALEHPAIVPVYDFGEQEGQPFLVMRYMSGGSLVPRIRLGPIPASEAARILVRIGAALDAAHAKGVVHRDLKPANILFDQYGEAYLGDFGIAQISGSATALTGSMILGTPAYMSPEQISGGKKLDGRSDIYALGIVAFEMLTGQAPFQAESPIQMMMMHLSTPPPRMPETAIQLPRGSNEVLEKALAKEPQDRYQKAADFSNAFLELSTGQRRTSPESPTGDFDYSPGTPILPPNGGLERDWKQTPPPPAGGTPEGNPSKHRWSPWLALTAAVAACLCLTVGGGGTIVALSGGRIPLPWIPAASTATLTATFPSTGVPTFTLTPGAELPTFTPTAAPPKPGEAFLLTDGKEASRQPEIAVDSKGVVHAFWMDKTDPMNGRLIHRALPPGGSWTDPECASCLAGDPKYVSDYKITSRGDGKVCVGFAWSPDFGYVVSTVCYLGSGPGESRNVTMPSGDINFLFHLDPAGKLITLFTTTKSIQAGDQVLKDGSLDMYDPSFAIDSKGGYHLAWIRDSEPPVLVYRYSADRGISWSDPKGLIRDKISIADDLRFFAGPEGEVYLLIYGINQRILRWDGNWSAAASLPDGFVSSDFSFVTDSDGQAALLSLGYFSGKVGVWVFRRDDSSGTWSQPILVEKLEDRTELGLSAAIGSDNRLYVAYAQSKNNYLTGDIRFLETSLPW
jgi:hypothetical protein